MKVEVQESLECEIEQFREPDNAKDPPEEKT